MTDAPRISWKVKVVGLLMGLGLALRWLAGQRSDVMERALSEMLLAFDWLILMAIFCALLYLPLRGLARFLVRRHRAETDGCRP